MIRIVIAEEQQLLLRTIDSLLSLEDDIEVVGQARSGEEAIALVKQLQPDVCIIDINMPKKSGLEVAEELKDLNCKVVILTTFVHADYVKSILQADVWGYILKDSPSEKLVHTIRNVAVGERIFDPVLMEETKNEDPSYDDHEPFPNVNFQQQVKSYITTIMDKIKLPTA